MAGHSGQILPFPQIPIGIRVSEEEAETHRELEGAVWSGSGTLDQKQSLCDPETQVLRVLSLTPEAEWTGPGGRTECGFLSGVEWLWASFPAANS